MAESGVTGRVNAVAPLAFDGADADRAIDEAVAWQTARAIPPCFKIADGACAPADLEARLAGRGWRAHAETLVMSAPLADVLARSPAARADLSPDCDDAIDAVVRETAATDREYAERRAIARRTPQPRRFARLDRDGATAAIGLCVLTGAHAAVFLMRTAPAYRRQGLARRVLAALLGWARDAGAAETYLQVEASNAPAIALYRAAGFRTAYAYRYWRPATAAR